MELLEREFENAGFIEQEKRDEKNGAEQIRDELDLPPEFCEYRDEGCKLFYACLECPYPDCLEDRFRGCLSEVRKIRDREIVRLKIRDKVSVRELSARFNVCKRTVRRALKAERKNNE